MRGLVSLACVLTALSCAVATAQSITLPPSGDNQRSAVTQQIGPVRVSTSYSSPDVHGPNGEDRRGQVFGGLVPYGLHDLGTPDGPKPWRAGANENTVVEVSHAVTVEGQPLPAGRYGLHMIAGATEWTVIFSKNSTSWGSFSYDDKEDQLRVRVTPQPAPYREWLSYEFLDRKPDRATVALEWDELRVPFTIVVPNVASHYLTTIRNELRNAPGFTWQGWQAAARFCLQQNVNLEEALTWADNAIRLPGVGQANFTTYETRAAVLSRLSREPEAATVMDEALRLPNALPIEIHQYGRQLQARGRHAEALTVYKKNAERFGDAWPTHVGLARGYSAMGDYPRALEHAQKALVQAPDALNKRSLEHAVARLTQGKDMNTTG